MKYSSDKSKLTETYTKEEMFWMTTKIEIESFEDFIRFNTYFGDIDNPRATHKYEMYKIESRNRFTVESFSEGGAWSAQSLEEVFEDYYISNTRGHGCTVQVMDTIHDFLKNDTTFNRTFKGEK